VTDSLIGTTVAGHRVERFVGRGGMGVVYQAVELSLERTVALKLIAPELAGEPGFRERFIAESKMAASIDHPNVLPVFNAGEDHGVLFLSMRFVDGDNLRTIVRRDGPLDPRRAADIVAHVASALDAAHARQLVHRDVKPANVLMAGGDHVYLTDFGLVKDLGLTAGHTRTGEVLGTLDYVAPERIRGEAVGPWSDVYALGCVLFFLLTGQVVFPLDSPESKLWAHISDPPPSVSAGGSRVSAAFDDVVRQALAKDPRQRYRTATALAAAALDVVASAKVAGPELPDAERESRLAAPIAQLLDAARRSERGIRLATEEAQLPYREVSAEVDRFVGTLRRTAAHAQLLLEALEELPPERVERRLAEVRSGHDPGKAQLVEALALQLAVQRRMQAKLDSFYADMERILVELDTVRGQVLSASPSEESDAERRLAGSVSALGDELGVLAEDMDTVFAERTGLGPAESPATEAKP
jgi:Protein kinase domain